jgi:hypothetical protein
MEYEASHLPHSANTKGIQPTPDRLILTGGKMSRIRGSTLVATIVTMLVMAVGAITLAPTAASASPKKHYPPPPPSLTVDRGVVKPGTTVRATGRKYGSRERIYVTVSFKPNNSRHWRTVKATVIRADRNGKFSIKIKLYSAGQVVITARGTSSHKSASAFVYVLNKRGGHGGSWSIRPAAYSSPVAAKPAPSESSTPGLAVAGLAVLALTSGAAITRKTIRRRRKANPVA